MSTPLFKRFKRIDHIGLIGSAVAEPKTEAAVPVTGPADGQFAGITTSTLVRPFTFQATTDTGQVVTDDGEGNLIGDVDGGGANTINYITGAYDFTAADGILSTTADLAYEAGGVADMRTIEIDLTDDNGAAMEDLDAIAIHGGTAAYRMWLVPESETGDTTLIATDYEHRTSLYNLYYIPWRTGAEPFEVPNGRWSKLIVLDLDWGQWQTLNGATDRENILLLRNSAGSGRTINWKSRKASGASYFTPGVVAASAPAFDQ